MERTKISLLISILFLTFTLNSFAQTDKEQIDLTGKWALQFQIDRYFTLSSFQGGTISAKYHLNNNSALRFGVTLGYESKDIDLYEKDVYSDTTEINEYSGEISSSTIQLAIQYLQYLEMNNSISAFIGIGFNYTMQPQSEDIKDYLIMENDFYGYGVDLLLGTEWFVRSNIGLHAEYGIGFGYTSHEYSYERPSYYSDDNEMNKDSENLSGFELYNNYVKFGVSIYF